MKLLAFYLGRHDSSVAAAVDGRVRYAKSERVTGFKHHRADIGFVEDVCRRWNIRPDAVAFSDGNRNNLGICPPELLGCQSEPVLPFLRNVPTFCVDHHYAHVLSTWPVVPTESVDIGFALDGNGDHSFRRRVFANPGRPDARSIHDGFTPSFGMLLEKIGMLMELGGHLEDLVGKVMGAQAYGEVDLKYIENLDLDDMVENRLYDFIKVVPWRGIVPEPDPHITYDPWPRWHARTQPDFFTFENPSFRDWLATLHFAIELYVERFFLRYAEPDQVIGYAGGCAQNVVCNERLSRRYPRLHVVPHGYDGGLSLGCLEFLRIQLGLPPFSTEGFPFWQDDEVPMPRASTIERVAEMLAQGKIVGWMQGRGEIGPRALGHRSILMSPALPDGKETLNSRVKHREPWRPYAPSVLQSHVSEFFEMDGASPFMLRSVNVRPSQRSAIPAVVHVDGTARVQTVPENGHSETASYAALLDAFRRRTGIPMLLNTSLNAGGSPIFATADQSLDLYNSVAMDALCIGDELYVK